MDNITGNRKIESTPSQPSSKCEQRLHELDKKIQVINQQIQRQNETIGQCQQQVASLLTKVSDCGEKKCELEASNKKEELSQCKAELQNLEQQYGFEEQKLNGEKQQLETLHVERTGCEEEMKFLETRETIYCLFEGQENFEALPELDTSVLREKHQAHDHDPIDFIRPEDMAHEIMTGEDQGRPFFAIKDEGKVQVFFQQHSGMNDTWAVSSWGGEIIDTPTKGGLWIEGGSVIMSVYHQLRNLIQRILKKISRDVAKTPPKHITPPTQLPVSEQICAIFGGSEKFHNLRILHTEPLRTKYRARGNDIDFIRPEDMEAPVMRGEDQGRPFFAIKEGERVQVFFQKEADNSGTWTDAKAMSSDERIILCPPDWMENNIPDPDVSEELHQLLKRVASA